MYSYWVQLLSQRAASCLMYFQETLPTEISPQYHAPLEITFVENQQKLDSVPTLPVNILNDWSIFSIVKFLAFLLHIFHWVVWWILLGFPCWNILSKNLGLFRQTLLEWKNHQTCSQDPCKHLRCRTLQQFLRAKGL